MRYFITGASGWIGSAVVAELLSVGHEVVGLARSDASADRIAAAGATPVRGELSDPEALRRGAADSDGVVHLGFNHDFGNYADAGKLERAAVHALGDALTGSDRPLLIAAGIGGISTGRPATERDRPAVTGPDAPRGDSEGLVLSLADRGIRTISSRFAPSVHGAGDHGFVAIIVAIAREKGVSAYVEDGENRWPGVARSDAARAVRLAVEGGAPAGSILHVIGESGLMTREIAEVIGRHLGVPVTSIPRDEAVGHFGWMATFFGMDLRASNDLTRELLGWEPVGPTLREDLESGVYFR